MHDDFFVRLTASHTRLSAKMTQLADYVSNNYVDVAFMTTRQLAAAAGVSLATVVRFPAMLGYPDFDAFRASLQERVNFDLAGAQRLVSLPTDSRSPTALLKRIIDADIESLHGLMQTFSEPEFERFVDTIRAAERITILGFRYVSPLALYFGHALGKIKPAVQTYIQSDSSLYGHVRLLPAEAVLIVIAFVPYPADLVTVVRYAHHRGVRVLALTDSPLSSVLPLAEQALFVKASALDFVGSLAAPAALINCIISEVGVRQGEQAIERLQALFDAANEAGIFERAGNRTSPFRGKLLAWHDTPPESAASNVSQADFSQLDQNPDSADPEAAEDPC